MTEKTNNVGWNFDNSYSRLPKIFYSSLKPAPVRAPELVKVNDSLAASMGFDAEALTRNESVEIFAGNSLPDDASPLAQAYAGHQFGHFNMLGDGRAILLGEQITPDGERFDIQLKGSGRTPYSRGGDGRAALGPMLREYIISEAMFALGIPTTRSLAVVTTGESVYRETELPGAILTRVAASHLRVGTFQFAARWGSDEDLLTLADYTIKRHYPEVEGKENPYFDLLKKVMERQAELIAKWMLVGFIHGVMNTDNVSICGETIDYGPCAFIDTYDPKTVFSSIDRQGRYAYSNQPLIGGWNLARFAETLLPLLHEDQEEAIKLAQDELADFTELYRKHWLAGMRRKLGLFNEESEDEVLFEELLRIMQKYQADYTNTFRALTMDKNEGTDLFDSEEFSRWLVKWQERRERQEEKKEASQKLMENSNPVVIPRNHRVEEALEAAVEHGDYNEMEDLLAVLKNPFDYSTEDTKYTTPPAPSVSCAYRTFCGT